MTQVMFHFTIDVSGIDGKIIKLMLLQLNSEFYKGKIPDGITQLMVNGRMYKIFPNPRSEAPRIQDFYCEVNGLPIRLFPESPVYKQGVSFS